MELLSEMMLFFAVVHRWLSSACFGCCLEVYIASETHELCLHIQYPVSQQLQNPYILCWSVGLIAHPLVAELDGSRQMSSQSRRRALLWSVIVSAVVSVVSCSKVLTRSCAAFFDFSRFRQSDCRCFTLIHSAVFCSLF